MVLPFRLTSLGLQAGIRRRGDRHDEMGHIFDALLQMVVAPGELTYFVDLVVTSPLICVVHSRNGLDWPLASAMSEPSPEKMECRVSRHWPTCALCSKKSTYDIRTQKPRPGARSEGGI